MLLPPEDEFVARSRLRKSRSPRAKARLTEALTIYDFKTKSRLLEAYIRQRPELRRLLHRYQIPPKDADELLEVVVLTVLGKLHMGEILTADEWLLTWTEELCQAAARQQDQT
jgi:hypothetical protein